MDFYFYYYFWIITPPTRAETGWIKIWRSWIGCMYGIEECESNWNEWDSNPSSDSSEDCNHDWCSSFSLTDSQSMVPTLVSFSSLSLIDSSTPTLRNGISSLKFHHPSLKPFKASNAISNARSIGLKPHIPSYSYISSILLKHSQILSSSLALHPSKKNIIS